MFNNRSGFGQQQQQKFKSNVSNSNVAVSAAQSSSSVDREHAAAYSPSGGRSARYVPGSSLNNNSNSNSNHFQKSFDTSRGFKPPRQNQNQQKGQQQQLSSKPLQQNNNHIKFQNKNDEDDDDDKTFFKSNQSIMPPSQQQQPRTPAVIFPKNPTLTILSKNLNKPPQQQQHQQQQPVAEDASSRIIDRATKPRNPKREDEEDDDDDDQSIVSDSTISDDENDDNDDNDDRKKANNDKNDPTPVNEDHDGTASGNFLMKVSSNCLSRRIVFQRARKPDALPRPTKMIDLMKQTEIANNNKKHQQESLKNSGQNSNNNNNNIKNNNNEENNLLDEEIDPEDPLFAEKDFDLSGNTPLPPLEWSPNGRMSAGGGLNNVGATCFVNAVLQCYAYLPPFSQYLQNQVKHPHQQQQQHGGTSSSSPHTRDFLFMWAETTRNIMNLSSRQSFTPKPILQNLTVLNKNLNLNRQHDASEFAMALVDRAQISSLRRSGNVTITNNETGKCDVNQATQHSTMLMRLLGGWTRSRVTWAKEEEMRSLRKNPDPKIKEKVREIETADPRGASFRSTSYEDFTVLGLNDLTGSTIEECFEKFIESDSVEGFSTDRKGSVTCHKRVMIHQLPWCLTVMLGRFQMDPFTGRLQKKSKRIKFRTTLNMRPYLTEECITTSNMVVSSASTSAAGVASNGIVSGMPLVPQKRNGGGGDSSTVIPCDRYSLCGVVVHLGTSLRGGHYIAYVKAANGLWYEADDEVVRQVPDTRVLQQEAFMLFYVVDPDLMTMRNNNHNNINDNVSSSSPSSKQPHQQRVEEDAAASASSISFEEMAAGLSKKERRALKMKLKMQQEEGGEDNRQRQQPERDLRQQIQSTGQMMKQRAMAQEEELGAAMSEDEVEHQLQVQQKKKQQQQRRQQQEQEEFQRKREHAQSLIEAEEQKKKLQHQQQEQQSEAKRKVKLVIEQDHSSTKKTLLGQGYNNTDSDDDDNADEAELERRAREEHRRGFNDEQQLQQQSATTSAPAVKVSTRVRSIRGEASEAKQRLQQLYSQNDQHQQKRKGLHQSETSLVDSGADMRGQGGVDAQQNGTFIKLMNSKKQILMNQEKNDEDDEDVPIPTDDDNDNEEAAETEHSPLSSNNKKTKKSSSFNNQHHSPSTSGTFVQPQISIESQLKQIVKMGGDAEDEPNSNNDIVVLKGPDAAQALHQYKRQQIEETGGKLKRAGHQGKFARNQRDEQYNDELDRGRQKKMRKNMTRARDANLFPTESDVGNRFQQTADEKRQRKDREFDRDNYNDNNNNYNNYNNNNRRPSSSHQPQKQYNGGGTGFDDSRRRELQVERTKMSTGFGDRRGPRSE